MLQIKIKFTVTILCCNVAKITEILILMQQDAENNIMPTLYSIFTLRKSGKSWKKLEKKDCGTKDGVAVFDHWPVGNGNDAWGGRRGEEVEQVVCSANALD